MLLKSGADATLCSPTGETALSFAACQGQLDAVEQLLEYGADPDVANAVGLIYNINNSFTIYHIFRQVVCKRKKLLSARGC